MTIHDTTFSQSNQAPDFQQRLADLIKRVGGLRGAARVVGVHFDTVGRWRDGQQKMPFQAAAVLCQAAGVSLDWLAHGDALPDSLVQRHDAGVQKDVIDADDVREAAEFVIRVNIALESLKVSESSDVIADTIVRRARDLDVQRVLRARRAAEENVHNGFDEPADAAGGDGFETGSNDLKTSGSKWT